MINGQTLASVLDKLITKSEVAKNARIQVQMPNGDLHDIAEIKLMENMLIKKALGPCAIKLYAGSDILKLVGREPCTPVAESWSKVQEMGVSRSSRSFVNVT
jgi:hypothetical protein